MDHDTPGVNAYALRLRPRNTRPAPRLAYGYMRVSKGEQDCGPQRADIWHYYTSDLAPRGYTWGGWYEDIGISGGTPLLRRPEGYRLSVALERGDVVVASKLDRMFRGAIDCLTTVQAWQARGVEIALLDLRVDTTTESGELMLHQYIGFAQFERRRIGTRTREALAVRKAQGRPWNHPPYGYKFVGEPPHRRLVPDPEWRAWSVRFLWWRSQGWSLDRIYFHLLNHGAVRRDGKPWTRSNIHWCCERELRLQAEEQKRAAEGR